MFVFPDIFSSAWHIIIKYLIALLTILVQVRHFGVSEPGSNVGVPQQPLKDEHGQAQCVAVALQRDQLPVDGLRAGRGALVLRHNLVCESETEWVNERPLKSALG